MVKLNDQQLLLDNIHLRPFCPICGNQYLNSILNKTRDITTDGENSKKEYLCDVCNNWVIPYKLKYHFCYYMEYSLVHGGSAMDAMMVEVKGNPLFDIVANMEVIKREESAEAYRASMKQKVKCPSCGSTNTEKISTTSKVVGASLFGLFSKNATSQFKCKNCGYKW